MFTAFEVVIIATGLLAICLLTIYFYSVRINSCVQTNFNAPSSNFSESSDISDNTELLGQKTGKKQKKKKNDKITQNNEISTNIATNSSFLDQNDEEDIIALAALKGFDISGVRRRFESQSVSIASNEPLIKHEVQLENGASMIAEAVEAELIASENFSSFEQAQNQARDINAVPWSKKPTREDELCKILKNKLIAAQNDLEISETKLTESTLNLEKLQKRSILLEQELKEQRKNFDASKAVADAQFKSLMAHNLALTGKISKMEYDINNSEALKNSISRLQEDLQTILREKHDILRELSEVKQENQLLIDKSLFSDSLRGKCAELEQKLEAKDNELALQIETSQIELQLTRAKLESEIAFHCAEHANSVGSSTALHQEIGQLKSEISCRIAAEEILKRRNESLEVSNQELLQQLEDHSVVKEESLKIEIENLRMKLVEAENSLESVKKSFEDHKTSSCNELQNARSELINLQNSLCDSESKINLLSSEVASLKSDLSVKKDELLNLKNELSSNSAASADIETLRNQLAEAEIKMSSLQSDLAREIKRADISKKVYEAKLANLSR